MNNMPKPPEASVTVRRRGPGCYEAFIRRGVEVLHRTGSVTGNGSLTLALYRARLWARENGVPIFDREGSP